MTSLSTNPIALSSVLPLPHHQTILDRPTNHPQIILRLTPEKPIEYCRSTMEESIELSPATPMTYARRTSGKPPVISIVARKFLERLEAEAKQNSNEFVEKCLTRRAAIDAVDRILKYGRNEKDKPLKDSLVFRDQIRLTADDRLPLVLTSGASQVSKSLVNYLVAIDTLVSGQVSTGWFYASRQSMNNQQPEQFQKMISYWLKNCSVSHPVQRESVTRYAVGNATANFSYANSGNEDKSGGAAEGKEASSFSCSKLFCEERSNWRSTVDVTPRLGASELISKPVRELGTPGSGAGIERQMKDVDHLFCPAVFCPHCGQLTYLDPKGALLKPVKDKKTGRDRYFNARGEILDFWSYDGTPKTAYIACLHCAGEITADLISHCRLHCRKTGIGAEAFLDELPEHKVYPGSVAIYLSPLLRVPSDPFRVHELVKEGLDPHNPSIYQQNKLGHPSETDTTGVSIADYQSMAALPAWDFNDRTQFPMYGNIIRVGGCDQGRDSHYLVALEYQENYPDRINILLADTVGHDEILAAIDNFNLQKNFIDNEPDRLSAYDLVLASDGRLKLADQRSFEGDLKEIKVMHGGKQLPCYAINQSLFKDKIVAGFKDPIAFRIAGKVHRKFERHITSVKRDPDSLQWVRPADHDDDLFFALMLALAAQMIPKEYTNDWY